MQHACRMLENKTATVADVITALGYSDYKNFTQSFKEAFGMSPGEYQKQIKEKKEESEQVRVKTSFMQAKETFKTKAFTAPKPVQQFGTPKGGKLPYGVGDRVRHIKFGEGTVTAIIEGGRDYEVTVHFDGPGTKKMFATFARLQKV